MKALLLSAALVLMAAPAFAADLPSPAAPPPPPPVPAQYNWTGVTVGGNIGWAWGANSYDVYRATSGAFLSSGSSSSTTFHGGPEVGIDYMFPQSWVIGLQASVNWGTGTSSSTTTATSSATSKTSGEVSGSVLAKAGYAFGDLLPYVVGGWAWSDDTVIRTQLLGNGAPPVYSDKADVSRAGLALGGGLAYHVWGNWEVHAEYEHVWFGNVDVYYSTANLMVKSTAGSDSIHLGVDYKF